MKKPVLGDNRSSKVAIKDGTPGKSRDRILPYLTISFVIAYIAVLSYLMRAYFLDDAYIGFRYLDNLLSGNGLVFNVGERVEGITNIGWIFVLLPLATILNITLSAKILGFLFLVATLILTYRIGISLGSGDEKYFYRIFALGIPILVGTQFDFILFSSLGMETAFFSFLLCLIVYLAVIDRHKWLIALLSSYLYLVHPECLIVFPIALLINFRRKEGYWRAWFPSIIIFIVAIIAYTTGRFIYYSDFVTNTAHAKPFNIIKGLAGVYSFFGDTFYKSNYSTSNIPNVFKGIFVFTFLAVGFLSIKKKSRLAASFMLVIVAVGILFSALTTRDWTYMARYFAPYTPLGFILLWRGVIDVTRRMFTNIISPAGVKLIIALYLLTIVSLNFGSAVVHLSKEYIEGYPGFVLYGKNLVKPSKWMGENLPADAVIATIRIGSVAYYSKKNIFDYGYGLTNKEVAKLVEKQTGLLRGSGFKTPGDPKLEKIWKEVSPNFILQDNVVDSLIVHDENFRLMKTFDIGRRWKWALYGKVMANESSRDKTNLESDFKKRDFY
jgi:hypothetical protein